ncbi:hypothetical protein OG943_12155 [Amycolatopsis sp. NBC_00345]|uniref:DUF6924 domain-containing protein n=1 Tax=Amycolatopsis sp. NBC_00345 TaxID=2975955 RepID=UPI002E26FF6D
MERLPDTKAGLLIRTDFADQDGWDAVYRDATVEQLTARAPEWALLVVRVRPEGNGRLRVIPAELWSVENNISLGNMDWQDFTSAAGADGVFRGFGG